MIDLHVHSNASDGTLSPSAVVEYASVKKLSAIALTDHDTIAGLKEAAAAADSFGVELIPGIEMSCLYGAKEIHILGYFIDPDDAGLTEDLAYFRKKREERNDIILDNFAEDGMIFTKEELRFGNPDTVITRAHFARLLVEKGYVTDVASAFKKYLVYGGKYCPRKKDITPEKVMEMFQRHKIWASLAHPYQYKLSNAELLELVGMLKALGLRGIEVYHSSHHLADTARLETLARVNGLIGTGGTDFHGENKPDIDLGTGFGGMKIPERILTDMKTDYQACLSASD
jgi:predicted metal-dependent phosphoesterase TrpH